MVEQEVQMKYREEMYLGSGIYDICEEEMNHNEKIVKCRKEHKCASCGNKISSGEKALYETAFVDGAPASAYTCLKCVEECLEESGQVEQED